MGLRLLTSHLDLRLLTSHLDLRLLTSHLDLRLLTSHLGLRLLTNHLGLLPLTSHLGLRLLTNLPTCESRLLPTCKSRLLTSHLSLRLLTNLLTCKSRLLTSHLSLSLLTRRLMCTLAINHRTPEVHPLFHMHPNATPATDVSTDRVSLHTLKNVNPTRTNPTRASMNRKYPPKRVVESRLQILDSTGNDYIWISQRRIYSLNPNEDVELLDSSRPLHINEMILND